MSRESGWNNGLRMVGCLAVSDRSTKRRGGDLATSEERSPALFERLAGTYTATTELSGAA
jgi:hypothetical protein